MKQHPTASPPGYPAHLEDLVTLDNGESLWIRPLVPADSTVLAAEFAGADADTLYMRFLNPFFELTPKRLSYLTEIDYHRHVALVAMVADGDSSEGVAVARFAGQSDSDAEVAVVVKPEFRRLGIARMLLDRLITTATEAGYATLSASYLQENHAVAALLARCGFESPVVDSGVVSVSRGLTVGSTA